MTKEIDVDQAKDYDMGVGTREITNDNLRLGRLDVAFFLHGFLVLWAACAQGIRDMTTNTENALSEYQGGEA